MMELFAKIGSTKNWLLCLFLLYPSRPCIKECRIRIKINLNFYFHTSLRCLKRFYEGLKGLIQDFLGLSFFLRGRKLYAIGTKQLQLGDKRVLLSVLWQVHYWTPGHWWQNLPKIDIIKRFLELGKTF